MELNAKSHAIACIVWTLLWIPISFLFPQNPHFLFGLFSPLMGFIAVFDSGGWSGNTFSEVTLPWLVFWFVLIGVNGIVYYFDSTPVTPDV